MHSVQTLLMWDYRQMHWCTMGAACTFVQALSCPEIRIFFSLGITWSIVTYVVYYDTVPPGSGVAENHE